MMKDKNSSGREKRVFIRVEYNIPVTIEPLDVTVSSCKGELIDISAQGAMCETHDKLYPGLMVKLSVRKDKDIPPLIGIIKWVRPHKELYRIGVQLDEAHAERNDRAVEALTEIIIDEIKSKH